MNHAILEDAQAALAEGPMPLKKLHERLKMAGSTWSESQHCLLFLALDGFSVDQTGNQVMVSCTGQSPKDRLLTDIMEVVESFAGKPVSAGEVRKRLQADYVTTDEQIKSIVKISEKLEVFGPGLIRRKQ